MTEYSGYHISTGFLAGNLLSNSTGIDVGGSAAEYARVLQDTLEHQFPGATVRVGFEMGEGSLPSSLKTQVYAPGATEPTAEEDGLVAQVDAWAEEVWQHYDWAVDETAPAGQECESCAEIGKHGVPATGRSTNPGWIGYWLCDECRAEYDSRPRI